MKQNPCRYCALAGEYKGRRFPSYSPECRECENIKKHREYLKIQRKYEPGERINRLDVLLKQELVYCGYSDNPMHIEAVKSWQLRIVLKILKDGKFYKAVRKEREEK